MGGRLVLLHYHENFLVEKLGGGLIPKSNSYIHTYMEYCEYYYLLFPSAPFAFAFCGSCARVACGPIGKVGDSWRLWSWRGRAWQGMEFLTRLP